MNERLGSDAQLASTERVRDGITFVIAIVLMATFSWLVLVGGRPNPFEAFFGLSSLFITLAWVAVFSGSMSLSRHWQDERPYLTFGRGVPAFVLLLLGTGWLCVVSEVYFLRGNPGFAIFNSGIALMYGCIPFPARLSLRRAAISGIGLLLSSIGVLFGIHGI